jgi:hypothetical protein
VFGVENGWLCCEETMQSATRTSATQRSVRLTAELALVLVQILTLVLVQMLALVLAQPRHQRPDDPRILAWARCQAARTKTRAPLATDATTHQIRYRIDRSEPSPPTRAIDQERL